MIELYLSKNNNHSSEAYGKYYPRVSYKETLDIHLMAKHMAEHNTPITPRKTRSEGKLVNSRTANVTSTVTIVIQASMPKPKNTNGSILRYCFRVGRRAK